MQQKEIKDRINREEGKPYDLTEETSRRPGTDDALASGATDAQEEWNREAGQSVSHPSGDSAGENKVATSLDDD
jgi:hypothetical protein